MTRALLLVLLLGSACRHAPQVLGPDEPLSLPVEGPGGARTLEPRRAVVLVWASWCEQCTAALEALAGGQGTLVAINEDVDPRHAQAAARAAFLPGPLLRDPEARTARLLGVQALPTLLLVDDTGRVRGRWDSWDARVHRELEQTIEGIWGSGGGVP